MKTATIGEILFDCFPGVNRLGGAPCNVAVMLSQLGCESTIISAIGEDCLGNQALKQLQQFGLNLSLVQRVRQPTGQVSVSLDGSGKPTYDFPADCAYDHLVWNEHLAAAASTFDAICFGTLAQRGAAAITIRKFLSHTRADALRVLDLNLRAPFYNDDIIRESLNYANVLKLNDEELPILARTLNTPIEDTISTLIQGGIQLVALTLGKKGAELHTRKSVSFCPAAAVKRIVDTVGAGDSYTAVLISDMLRRCSLDHINYHANQVAALVCSVSGAFSTSLTGIME